MIDLSIDFNGMSTYLGLFYSVSCGNCVHCTFIFTFYMYIAKFFYTKLYDIKYSYL